MTIREFRVRFVFAMSERGFSQTWATDPEKATLLQGYGPGGYSEGALWVLKVSGQGPRTAKITVPGCLREERADAVRLVDLDEAGVATACELAIQHVGRH